MDKNVDINGQNDDQHYYDRMPKSVPPINQSTAIIIEKLSDIINPEGKNRQTIRHNRIVINFLIDFYYQTLYPNITDRNKLENDFPRNVVYAKTLEKFLEITAVQPTNDNLIRFLSLIISKFADRQDFLKFIIEQTTNQTANANSLANFLKEVEQIPQEKYSEITVEELRTLFILHLTSPPVVVHSLQKETQTKCALIGAVTYSWVTTDEKDLITEITRSRFFNQEKADKLIKKLIERAIHTLTIRQVPFEPFPEGYNPEAALHELNPLMSIAPKPIQV